MNPADRVRRLIAGLDDDDPRTREAASLQANSLDGDCLGPIESAIASNDLSPEVQARLGVAVKYVRPRARRERRRQARADWESKVLRDAYAGGGGAGSAWDAPAVRGIDLFVALGDDPPHAPAARREAALVAFKEAAGKGCKDSLIVCLWAAANGRPDAGAAGNPGPGPIRGVLAGRYPPAAKLLACLANLRGDVGAVPDAYEWPARLLPEVAKTPGLPPGELDAWGETFYEISRRDGDRWRALGAFLKAYEAAAHGSVGAAVLSAREKIDSSYDQRAAGWGPAAAAPLAAAAGLLEKAWKTDPSDPRPASLMVFIETIREGDRGAVETWFERAIAADPDDLVACQRKLQYLLHGPGHSAGEAVRFGRACLETRNYRAGVPFILVQAHDAVAEQSPDRAEYFRRDDVWEDLESVYEGALANVVDDAARASWRSSYARAAARAGRWTVARRQFELLAGRPDLTMFGSREAYEYLRRKAERMAGAGDDPATAPARPTSP